MEILNCTFVFYSDSIKVKFKPQNSRMEKKLALSAEKGEMLLQKDKYGDPFAEITFLAENL